MAGRDLHPNFDGHKSQHVKQGSSYGIQLLFTIDSSRHHMIRGTIVYSVDYERDSGNDVANRLTRTLVSRRKELFSGADDDDTATDLMALTHTQLFASSSTSACAALYCTGLLCKPSVKNIASIERSFYLDSDAK